MRHQYLSPDSPKARTRWPFADCILRACRSRRLAPDGEQRESKEGSDASTNATPFLSLYADTDLPSTGDC